jgi:Uma2 family endonuclease
MSTAELPVTQTPPPANGRATRTRPDPYDYDGEHLFEVVNGVRVEKPVGLIETRVAAILYRLLANHCAAAECGHAAIESLFELPTSGNDRKPDVAFVSYQRWPQDRPLPRVNAWPVVPDLAVEVVSPTDKMFDVFEKVAEYFAAGVQQVWLILSNVEQVLVFTAPAQVRLLTRDDELAADPVVPGFRTPLPDLFPPSEPARANP